MIPATLAARVRRLRWHARRAFDPGRAGPHAAPLRGDGLQLREVRPLADGDDARLLDPFASARLGSPHVKQFAADRERTVWLVRDGSASVRAGAGDAAADVLGLLALVAAAAGDRVGWLGVTDRVERIVPPRPALGGGVRLVGDLLGWRPTHPGTALAAAADALLARQRRRALVAVSSDFRDPQAAAVLRRLAARHELLALHVAPRRVLEPPPTGRVRLRDAESGRVVEVNAADPVVRQRWRDAELARRDAIRRAAPAAGWLDLVSDADPLGDVARWLRRTGGRR